MSSEPDAGQLILSELGVLLIDLSPEMPITVGAPKTRFCPVQVVASPTGIVTHPTIEDGNAGTGVLASATSMYGSTAARSAA